MSAVDTTGSPGDLYDGEALAMRLADDSHDRYTNLAPGLYLSDPQGHAFLAGANGRGLAVLNSGPGLVEIGSVQVTSPQVLEELADRLRMLASRMRERAEVAR